MTRDEAKKALEEAGRTKPEVQKFIYSQAVWDAKSLHLSQARTERGEGLAGMWTSLADEVFSLVAFGILTKQNWMSYFNACRPEIEMRMRSHGDAEGVFRSRDPDQINTCINGLAKLIAIIPSR